MNQGGNSEISFSTTLETVVATVDVAGSVTRNNGKTEYLLRGRQTLDVGFGSQEAEFIWTQESLHASVNIQAGSTIDVSAQMRITTPGSFLFKAKARVSIAGVRPELEVGVTNCVDSDCSRHTTDIQANINGTLTLSGVHFSIDAEVSSSGRFSASLSTHGKLSGSVSAGIADARGSISWRINATVSNSSFSLSVSGRGKVQYRTCFFGCSRWKDLVTVNFSGSVNSRGKVSGSLSFTVIGIGASINV